MLGNIASAALAIGMLVLGSDAFAQQGKFGSAGEARAMLERVVAALREDEKEALASFNKADGGFRDRDLYPFCFMLNDGKVVAHISPGELGKDVRTIVDAAGQVFGLALFNSAKQGQVVEVRYMWPRPGSKVPEQKISYVTRIGNVGCGVGYYA